MNGATYEPILPVCACEHAHALCTADCHGREYSLLAGVRMVATLGHSCGLVDPYSGDATAYSPMLAILRALAQSDPWLVESWEYKQAIARCKGGLAY